MAPGFRLVGSDQTWVQPLELRSEEGKGDVPGGEEEMVRRRESAVSFKDGDCRGGPRGRPQ